MKGRTRVRDAIARLGPEARAGLLGVAALLGGFWLLAAVLKATPSGSPAPAAPRDLPAIKADGTLRVALDPTSGAPYCVRQQDGTLAGFEPDLARAVGRTLGLTVAFEEVPWRDARRVVVEGRADLAWNAFEVRDGAGIRFSKPYYTASQAILVPTASSVFELEGLAGRKVGATEGSVAEAILRRLHPPARVVAFPDTEGPLRALEGRQLDAVLTEAAMGRAWLKAHGRGFRVVGRPILPRPYGVAVRAASPKLREAVDQALVGLKRSGEWRRILESHGVWEPLQAPGKAVPAATGPLPAAPTPPN
ncbi:MAG: ABC transporter substrate-binding protein [Candidatus Sericytochromatia bacterium]|nr:ABC transporter substrate-binding protein [Candidatus Sericytochromatia bacterium]